MPRRKTAVTLITGYLGAGKTTLVNALVSSLGAGARVAVIVNEFGEVGIDGALIAETAGGERVYELANGCLCCLIVGEFRKTLTAVASQGFTHALIETSGAADPTAALKILWGAPELTARCRLDGVVCVADAVAFADTVERDRVALTQVSVADAVLLTKTTRAGSARVRAARALVSRLNPAARLLEHEFAGEPGAEAAGARGKLGALLALDAFRKPGPVFTQLSDSAADHGDLASIAASWEGEVKREVLQGFFRTLALDERIVRVKAIIKIAGEPLPWLIHGVQSWFERGPAPKSYKGPNRLVVLGRGCDSERLRQAIDSLRTS